MLYAALHLPQERSGNSELAYKPGWKTKLVRPLHNCVQSLCEVAVIAGFRNSTNSGAGHASGDEFEVLLSHLTGASGVAQLRLQSSTAARILTFQAFVTALIYPIQQQTGSWVCVCVCLLWIGDSSSLTVLYQHLFSSSCRNKWLKLVIMKRRMLRCPELLDECQRKGGQVTTHL